MKKTFSILVMFACYVTSLFSATQAVIFDFGGVMTTDYDRKPVIAFLQTTFDLSRSEFEKANREKHEAIKQGISDDEFWISYAEKNGIVLPENWSQSLKTVMMNAVGVNPSMYCLVEELHEKNLTVGMLSNIDWRLAKLIREFGYYEPFDPCLLSYEIGYDKPDPKVYQLLINTLRLPPQDVVFIDDKRENVAAAKAEGIDAILFTSESQLRQELSKRL